MYTADSNVSEVKNQQQELDTFVKANLKKQNKTKNYKLVQLLAKANKNSLTITSFSVASIQLQTHPQTKSALWGCVALLGVINELGKVRQRYSLIT